jgi:hypothetical protein
MPWADVTRVLIYKNSAWVDITEYVRFRRTDLEASTGRATELEQIGPGRMAFGIDNSTGNFTPGSAYASLELTLGMPVRLVEQIGYRSFPLWHGALQLPETSESLEGVDNLVVVTAVDGKELLDNGRTFISTLAEHIIASPGTLVHFYPLNETAPPWRDVVGGGDPMTVSLSRSSLANDGVMAPAYTPGGGPSARGDDLRGVLFTPDMSTVGGFGFPMFASGYQLNAITLPDVSLAPGELLTLIVWVGITDADDDQFILQANLFDATFSQQSTLFLHRFLYHTSAGANAGLLKADLFASFGGSLDNGIAATTVPFRTTGGTVQPVGVQLSYSPNTLKLWLGREEFVSAAPTGTANNPQRIGDLVVGAFGGAASYVQVHVGDYTQANFIAQAEMGLEGLAGQRTDERVATILSYAGAPPAQLDQGVTYMRATALGGRKPGDLIDEATVAEQGRFFFDGEGVATFHSRQRVYNV